MVHGGHQDSSVGGFREREQPIFESCHITAAANGWIIQRPIGSPIVVQYLPDEDNVARLLAQLEKLFGETDKIIALNLTMNPPDQGRS